VGLTGEGSWVWRRCDGVLLCVSVNPQGRRICSVVFYFNVSVRPFVVSPLGVGAGTRGVMATASPGIG